VRRFFVFDVRKQSEVLPRRVHGGVRSVVGGKEKPGLIRFPLRLYPAQNFVGEKVGEVRVGILRHRFPVPLDRASALGRKIAVAPCQHAAEVIESAVVGMKAVANPEVPLSD
jgi:hypothetical protein